jgi:peptidoglycan/LPS O-acetylase OafA/YrhL
VQHVGSAYVYNAFDTRFDNLAVGCLMAMCINRSWLNRFAGMAARASWMPFLTLALLLLSRLAAPLAYHYSIGFTVDALIVALLILQLLQLSHSRVWSWLDHPVPRYLGVISYPLYLYHGWGLSVGEHIPGLPATARLIAAVGATIILAAGSYFVVEKPCLRLKKRWETFRRPVARG